MFGRRYSGPVRGTSHGRKFAPHFVSLFRPPPTWSSDAAVHSASHPANAAMKRLPSREMAYAESVLDSAADLLKVRLTALIRHAVEREFSPEHPLVLQTSQAPPFNLEPRLLQITAEGIFVAARERAALLVAQAVAERLTAGDGANWMESKRALEQRAHREFDKYVREERDATARRTRLAQLRSGSAPTPRNSLSAKALRARLAALQL